MDIEAIARICHEVNRGLCLALHDYSQRRWEDAPEWIRDSVRDGVARVHGGRVEPEQSHASWSHARRLEGWTYGENKSEDTKTHPNLVPFDDLPPEQQLKDHLFVTTAKVLLGAE